MRFLINIIIINDNYNMMDGMQKKIDNDNDNAAHLNKYLHSTNVYIYQKLVVVNIYCKFSIISNMILLFSLSSRIEST